MLASVANGDMHSSRNSFKNDESTGDIIAH
jgi:hypothetical protein